MGRHMDPGPVSSERLYQDKDGNLTTDRATGVKLVAAAGAPISPEFHDQVRQHLAAQEAEGGTDQQRKPAASREAAVRAEEAEGRAEVKTGEPKRK
jgi:hypothetical protein